MHKVHYLTIIYIYIYIYLKNSFIITKINSIIREGM